MPDPFRREVGIAAPLMRDNIDTDAIIPSREMRTVSKSGLAEGLFADWRYVDASRRQLDPAFVLNKPRYKGVKFIVSGDNFGCGSSREHAAWALAEFGIRGIIAKGFNAIFFGNCVRNGIVPIALADAEVQQVAAHAVDAPDPAIVVDLVDCKVLAGHEYPFVIDAQTREMLLNGSDPIDLTMQLQDQIDSFRQADRLARPWVYLNKGEGQ